MEKHEFKVRALELIDLYCQEEFDYDPMSEEEKASYLDGTEELGLAATEIGDHNEISVQVNYDLERMAYVTELLGTGKHGEEYTITIVEPHDTMEQALQDLEGICFDSLVYPQNFDYDFMLREEEGE